MDDVLLSKDNNVYRRKNVVIRPVEQSSAYVHSLMEHFFKKGLPVPRALESEDPEFEAVEYIEGERVHPYKWTDEALFKIGTLVKKLHEASDTYRPDTSAAWKPWYLREIGKPEVYSHGDIAPWNIITKDGMPVGIIDWEFAGPIDPIVELARVCWLFPQLFDDDIAAMYDLPSPVKRAKQVRIITDAYGLPQKAREEFLHVIIETVICETAHEAIDAKVTFESSGPLWGMAWRTRSLYWIWRNRTVFADALI